MDTDVPQPPLRKFNPPDYIRYDEVDYFGKRIVGWTLLKKEFIVPKTSIGEQIYADSFSQSPYFNASAYDKFSIFSIKNTSSAKALALYDEDNDNYVLYYNESRDFTDADGVEYHYAFKEKVKKYIYKVKYIRTDYITEEIPEIGFSWSYYADIYDLTDYGYTPDTAIGVIKYEGSKDLVIYEVNN